VKQDLRKRKCLFYTTDHILDETYTILFRQVHFKEAKHSLDIIDLAIKMFTCV
jgi:hypothetical protein